MEGFDFLNVLSTNKVKAERGRDSSGLFGTSTDTVAHGSKAAFDSVQMSLATSIGKVSNEQVCVESKLPGNSAPSSIMNFQRFLQNRTRPTMRKNRFFDDEMTTKPQIYQN
jgi:hypothetical protein